MAITKEMLDELLKDYKGPEDLLGEEGLLKELTKALVESALGSELTDHLGYEKHDPGEKPKSNRRNGSSSKTIRTDQGPIGIDVPRDRDGEFEPKLIAKHQRELPGFSDKILSMYARGMTNREITEHLKEIYGVGVSPQFITTVTDGVVEHLEAWRSRELESVYPIVFFDAIVVKIRDHGHVVKRSIHLALAITLEGKKELLGLWIAETEGAKYWLGVMTELKNRGVQDILIAAVDGLSGFPEAIRTVFPSTDVQLCIVHVVRSSLRFVSYKDRKTVAAGMKVIYSAPTEEAALSELEQFCSTWDEKYPMIGKSWKSRWTEIAPFLSYPPEIRKVIYTTNAIESLNYSVRKVTKNRLAFPTAEAAMKLCYMAIENISKKWTMPIRHWSQALNYLAIKFEDRIPV
jgi:putative transposase